MKLRTAVIIVILVAAAYKYLPQAGRSLDSTLGKAAGGDDASEPIRSAPAAPATPAPRGSWMWDSQPGSLDQKPGPRRR